MSYRGPAPTLHVPVPMYSAKPDKTALQVPVDTHIKGTMVSIEVPELTPPGCAPTLISARTKAEAMKLAQRAIAHAEHVGLPRYNTEQGAAAKRRWSSLGDMG